MSFEKKHRSTYKVLGYIIGKMLLKYQSGHVITVLVKLLHYWVNQVKCKFHYISKCFPNHFQEMITLLGATLLILPLTCV